MSFMVRTIVRGPMKEVICCYQDYLDIGAELAPRQTAGWHFLYRGHASMRFQLLSMVGRKEPINGTLLSSEYQCFNEFKELVKDENWEQFKIKRYDEDMFYMSIGRHLGLDCRLLDWSSSFDTALYFASYDKKYLEEDGKLWVMCYPYDINDSGAQINPFLVKDLTLVKENYWSPDDMPIYNQPLGIARRFGQNGFFTISPSCHLTTPLNLLETGEILFLPFIITASAKKDIMNHLHGYGKYLYLSTSCSIESEIRKINTSHFQ